MNGRTETIERRSGTIPLPRKTMRALQPAPPGDCLLAAVSYLPVLCLVPYIIEDGVNPYLHFHTRQGLALFLAELAAGTLFFLPVVGPHLAAAVLAFLAGASGWACWHAWNGQCRNLPLLSPMSLSGQR